VSPVATRIADALEDAAREMSVAEDDAVANRAWSAADFYETRKTLFRDMARTVRSGVFEDE
jgi:hypothetical protein